ncbi:hypothetical protein KFU94_39005 [Chloroflexi bacterium TSY]|nr:hypothetical protein [Chloroflexi bacterium TSY]
MSIDGRKNNGTIALYRHQFLDSQYRYAQRRDDMLVYTSTPLEKELDVTGTSFITLYAASDCVDIDWRNNGYPAITIRKRNTVLLYKAQHFRIKV